VKVIRIGTRGSELALWQANSVAEALRQESPDLRVRMEGIRTSGDRKETPFPGEEGTGVFAREIEVALLGRKIDMAVHSLKDLPTELPEGLALGAILAREDPADVLIAKSRRMLKDLPSRAVVLTGAPRRQAQLLHRRPDLVCRPVRGNVPTRLRKFHESDAEAIVLARAGLLRLRLTDEITQRLEPEEFLPACGQGALAVEIRADDENAASLCEPLDDLSTRLCTAAERAFLAAVGAGCRAPAGAYGRFPARSTTMTLGGMVAALDGGKLVQRNIQSPVKSLHEAIRVGAKLAELVLSDGGREILKRIADRRGEPAA
jgi:hydroxymethylbilane synthase